MQYLQKTKYYVANGPIRVLVLAYSPIDAVAEALSYMGFEESKDIPKHLMPWPMFTVDFFGFRELEGSYLPRIHEDDPLEQAFAAHVVELGEALDYFDEINAAYDPFCEYDDEDRGMMF